MINSRVDCQLLGAPKPADELDTLCGTMQIVVLKSASGKKQANLLCARITEDVWICHPGSFNEEGNICSNNPFDVRDLTARDIVAEKFDNETKPRVRIRPGPKVSLVAIASANPSSWSMARTFAMWKAEEIKAEKGQFDQERAMRGFERNPFKWKTDGWASHIKICFLWSWRAEVERREIVSVRIHHLLHDSERAIPKPIALRAPIEFWWSTCEEVAKKLPLCKYLGEQTSDSTYEPDPSKWTGLEKSHTLVWFEWPHVFRLQNGRQVPHRVCIRLKALMFAVRRNDEQQDAKKKDDKGQDAKREEDKRQHGETKADKADKQAASIVPHCPLARSAPSNLIFTLEYMKGVAAWKHPKCEYIGLSYEGDRPAFELEVPDGGRGAVHFFTDFIVMRRVSTILSHARNFGE